MTDNSDYNKPRTNLFDLLPEVYKSGVNRSVLETTINRFLTKSETEQVIGYIGQGNPNAAINRQIAEPTPQRQAFQLQPMIYSKIGTIEHMSSWKDIENELERLGVDPLLMQEWGNALAFNWAPPIDYDKLINYRNYYWYNETDPTETPQYLTIRNNCNRAQAALDEYNLLLTTIGATHPIVGLDRLNRVIQIEQDLTGSFVEGFIFYVKNSTNPTINAEFFTVVSSTYTPGSNTTNIVVNVSGSPAFSDTIVDGDVSLEEGASIYEAARDCACNGELGWSGGLWDDNQIGNVLWNTTLIQIISYATEAEWETANCSGSPCPVLNDLWYDTTVDALKQYNGSAWVIVQNNFSTILAVTTGGDVWDLSEQCQFTSNEWIVENKWLHQNQVPNFALAQQAQIPVIEFLPTVELNEWTQIAYSWKYRSSTSEPWEDAAVSRPTLFELIGVDTYTIDVGLKEVVFDSRYGDMSPMLPAGTQVDFTGTSANDGLYTVQYALFCEETAGQKYQTRVRFVETFVNTTANGIITPELTSRGDEYESVYDQWVFVQQDEAFPTVHIPLNPMLILPTNPPLVPTADTYWDSTLGLFAEEVLATTKSLGRLSITAASSGSPNYWEVSGDHTAAFSDATLIGVGGTLTVEGNLGGGNNDYTITGVSLVGSNTRISVSGTIPTAATAGILGELYAHWTLTIDPTLRDETLIGTNDLRVYLEGVRQYGNYDEISAGGSPTPDCDYVGGILIRAPLEQYESLLVEVGAAACCDIGYSWVGVRTDESDGSFNPATDLVCTSLVQFKKLEQVKTDTNQYPLFDIFDVEGNALNIASRIFAFQEAQTSPVNTLVNKRIVTADDGREYFFEQYLTPEANGILYAYRESSSTFWYDSDNLVLYQWKNGTWNSNVVTSEFSTVSTSTVYYIAPVVSATVPAAPYIGIDGMLWYNTNNDTIYISDGTTWTADALLTADLTISDADPGLSSMWKTGPSDAACADRETYVPSWVDGDRNVLAVGDANGDWEIPDQLYFNPLHENRKIVSYTDLFTHFTSVIDNQVVPPGFLGTAAELFHMLDDVNFGLGGTIKEYNNSYDSFLSSVFNQTVNPVQLYEFAHDAYENALSQLKEFFRRDASVLMTNTTDSIVADLSGTLTTLIIAQYETNDAASVVYGDTTAYDATTGLGVRNWPATLPFLNLVHKVEPQQVYDPSANLSEMLHHDGHYSHIAFNATTVEIVNRRIIATDDTRSTNPTGKMGTSASSLPPDTFLTYQTQFGNTSAIYWYDISTPAARVLYRMSAVAVGTAAPAVDLGEGTFWYDTSANRLKILQSGVWVNDTNVAAGFLSDFSGGYAGVWEEIVFDKLFSDVVLEVETRLWQAAPTTTDLAFDFDGTFSEDPVLTDELFEVSFAEFVAQAEIADPFGNDNYSSSDPYTWNYKTAITPTTLPQIGSTYASGGDWRDVYQKNLGTPYPHFEPWVLQGYSTKPTWWDTQHPATAGRRWSTTMWQDVIDGVVPSGELLPDGNVSTGALGEVTSYNYMPVNINAANLTDNSGNVYAADDILPPVTIISPSATVRSLWTANSEVPNASDDFAYDDAGTVEWAWENASQYLYDSLKVAFKIQPIRFIHGTLGIDFISVGCLNVDQDTQKVYAHQNTLFHGDLLPNNTVYLVNGTLQWYTNFNRFSGYDTSSSNFRSMWSNWDTFLSYQFGTVLDTDSFLISSTVFDMVDSDYNITLKRSPGIEDHEVDALNVAILQSPPTLIGQDTQSQWVFNVGSFSTHGRAMPYYGNQSYNFTVDVGTNIFTTTDVYGRDMPWEDGQVVFLSSTSFLPSPLLANTEYYVTKVATNQFTLSEASGGPIIDILSVGVGTHTVFQVQSTFTALQGANTDAIWFHVELDTDLVLTLLPPTQMTGFQNLISFIDGYAAYSANVDNFRFNHISTDFDPDTGFVVNWQLEEERLISWAHGTRAANNFRRDRYTFIASASTDTFTYTDQVPGGWATGQAIDVFTETGTLPEPLLATATYYVIQGSGANFQLAITARNARNGVAIDVLTDGSGDFFARAALSVEAAPVFEVNPFRHNLWIETPQGIVADLNKGPFADVRTDQLLLDQYGNQLPTDGILPLREDTLTRINIKEGIPNTVSPIAPTGFENYNSLHLTSAHVYIDGYEHVILFSDYASAGSVIYDSFLGLNTAKFNVQMDRNDEFTLRPNLGGFVLIDNRDTTGEQKFSRNIEGQVEDLRYAYDTYQTNESNLIVSESRNALGYTGEKEYLNQININPKSQFIFWRGMIQQKGSVNSVKAFINSRRFVDAKIDEYWARKVADFGSTDEYNLPEIKLFATDGDLTELRIEFVDPEETADTGFVGISNTDEDRWYEYPNQKEFLDANGNMYFNAEATSVVQPLVGSPDRFTDAGGTWYHVTDKIADTVVITYYDPADDSTKRLVEDVDYTIINDRLVRFETTALVPSGNPTNINSPTIYTINPAEQRHNPAKIRDNVEDLTITTAILWDPARFHHYHRAIQLVDVSGKSDPALINYGYSMSEDTTQIVDYPYGSNAVDTTWFDTTRQAFVPYSDTRVFPDTFDRLRRWGKLADFGAYTMYQWTESDVVPSEYNALAEEQEGDVTIDERLRVNGRIREVVYEGDGGSPIAWTEYPYEVKEYANRVMYGAPPFPVTSARPASLYKNGVFVGTYTSSAAISSELTSSFLDVDHIHVVKYYPTTDDIDGVTFKTDTPYTTEQRVINGVSATKYYFWVGDKTVRQTYRNKDVSMVEAQIQLNNVPVPYVIVQKLDSIFGSPSTTTIPRRYVQAVVRGISPYVNADDRYVLRFTRDFTYRDNLSTGDELYGPDSVKQRHQEWAIFRQEQQFTIARVLWDALTESLIGQTIASLGGTAVRVPSLDKELYDAENNTSTRIGFDTGQAFCDGVQGWAAILAFLQDGDNDFAPIDINVFFETWDPLSLTPRLATDAQTISDMMDDIYNTFTFENVNRMWFSTLLTAALPFQHRYEDLFKTSFVALHGIRILETAGLFDD